jgi:hypothetical protein
VYTFNEYDEVIKLGYNHVILTLYRMRVNPDEVLDFAITKSPFAITMHWKVALSGLAYSLQSKNTLVYAHTVNDVNVLPYFTAVL